MSSSPSRPKQTVKRPKTKTFDILELFLNWQRKTTLATTSRVLLQQWRPAASWVVLSLSAWPAGWGRGELPLPFVSCSWSPACNFEISRTFLDVSSAEECWHGQGTGKQHTRKRTNCSAWRRESKGNLPAVCSYLTGYSVGYQGDGDRLFSEVHTGRMGGQQMEAGTQETQTQCIDFIFSNSEMIKHWISGPKLGKRP